MDRINAVLKDIKKSIKSPKELEYFLIHQDRYKFVLEEIQNLNLPEGAKILDIGCYPPHLFSTLQALGYEVWGIASKHEPVKNEKVVALNLETDKLPFKENFFELILFSEVIEHLVVSPKVYLPKLKKILKKGGLILITTPNAAHLKNRMKLLLGKNPSFSLNQLYETKLGDESVYYRHNREFTFDELKQILKDSGFKIVTHKFFSAYSPFREKIEKDSLVVKIIKVVGYLITLVFPNLKDSQSLLADSNK